MATTEQERIATAKRVQEFYLKYISVLYDKGSAYTNLVLIGGYGAFFALLSATRSIIPEGQLRWAASLMLVSVSVYVAFEVTKMIITAKRLLTNWKAFRQEEKTNDPIVINARFEELEKKELRQNIWFIPAWVFAVVVAVATAIVAVAIVLRSFVIGLF